VAALVVFTIDPQPLSPRTTRPVTSTVSHPASRVEACRALPPDHLQIHGSPPRRAPPGSNEKRKGVPYILTSCIVPAFWRIRGDHPCRTMKPNELEARHSSSGTPRSLVLNLLTDFCQSCEIFLTEAAR
jgi:hypothetical protein